MLNGQKLQGPPTAAEINSVLRQKGLEDKYDLIYVLVCLSYLRTLSCVSGTASGLWSSMVPCGPLDMSWCSSHLLLPSHFSQPESCYLFYHNKSIIMCWDVGSLPSSRRSDRPHFCSSGCQSRYSDTMQLFCMTASHQVLTSGHQWNSF